MKTALFVYKGDPMCFIHVLLTAKDMRRRGHEALIVVEGEACALIPSLAQENNPLHGLYRESKAQGLFAGACRACSTKLGVLDAVAAEGLPLLDDMFGHPSMAGFLEQGFIILTF